MSPQSILVIEDDQDMLESIADYLTHDGYTVRTARDGTEALEDLTRNSPPGLILLDLKLPVRTGNRLLEVIRESDKIGDVPVVVVSAFLGEPPAGATACLKKPFDPEQLMALVRKHARG